MIICAKYVLPMDKNFIKNGAVLVQEQLIKNIGTKQNIITSYPNEQTLDLEDAIIFPGFVNAHTHLEYSSKEFSSESKPFTKWLPQIVNKIRTFNEIKFKESINYGIEKLKNTGITTIADVSRTSISYEILLNSPYHSFIFHELVAIDDNLLLIEPSFINNKINNLIKGNGKPGISPHSLYTLSLQALKQITELTHKNNLLMMIHISESKDEMELIINGTGQLKEIMSKSGLKINYGYNKTPIQILKENNVLNSKTILVHCVNITDDDISILKMNKAGVVLCPKSNEFLQVGYPPIKKLLQAEICLGLGTDSLASNNSFNMFEEMQAIKKIYSDIDYKTLLMIATLNGAKILNMDLSIGSLTPGKYADLNAIKITNKAGFDPYEYICENAKIEDICFSMIKGKIFLS